MMVARLAWRGLWRNPRRTAVVVIAVAVGMAGCLVVIAINNGMVVQMVETAIATELGHVQIHAAGFEYDPKLRIRLEEGGQRESAAAESRAGVAAWAPRVRGQGLVNSPRASVGVRVLAVDPAREQKISRFASSLARGEWFGDRERRIVMGADLARRLKVDLGAKIVLSVQGLGGDLTGQAFRVAGLFETPSREHNQSVVLLRLAEAQQLFGLGDAVSEIVLLADARSRVQELRDALALELGDSVEVRTWEELQPLLVYMVDLFDQMAWFVYGGVFVGMAFGIANVLLMSVYERTREIGIMRAMGMKRGRVVAAVLLESIAVTALGLLVGLAVGVSGVLALSGGIDLSAFAQGLNDLGVASRIVPTLDADHLVPPLVMALVAALLASTWPAVRAARLRPTEALRRL